MDSGVAETQWRTIKSHPAYEVSDTGRVRHVNGDDRSMQSRGGYLRVWLTNSEGRSQFSVHCLVAEAFIGPRPDGHVVHHKNADRADNRLANLEYVTQSQNVIESLPSEYDGRIRPCDVRIMRRLADQYELTPKAIADLWGRPHQTIYDIVSRRTWKNIA